MAIPLSAKAPHNTGIVNAIRFMLSLRSHGEH
jgi:hypothetical protein